MASEYIIILYIHTQTHRPLAGNNHPLTNIHTHTHNILYYIILPSSSLLYYYLRLFTGVKNVRPGTYLLYLICVCEHFAQKGYYIYSQEHCTAC